MAEPHGPAQGPAGEGDLSYCSLSNCRPLHTDRKSLPSCSSHCADASRIPHHANARGWTRARAANRASWPPSAPPLLRVASRSSERRRLWRAARRNSKFSGGSAASASARAPASPFQASRSSRHHGERAESVRPALTRPSAPRPGPEARSGPGGPVGSGPEAWAAAVGPVPAPGESGSTQGRSRPSW